MLAMSRLVTLSGGVVAFGLLGVWVPAFGAETLSPGILAAEDFFAEPEDVDVITVVEDLEEEDVTLFLEVYELEPGEYRIVDNSAAKDDLAALNGAGRVRISSLVGDTGAEGLLLRGMGGYPGTTVISFGLPREYPELPKHPNGDVDVEAAAELTGPNAPAQFYAGRGYFEIDGVALVLENLSVGDHANNNTGVIQTDGASATWIMNDVWIFNVYDGLFWDHDDTAFSRFTNCIFYGTFQPWTSAAERDADGYTHGGDGVNPAGAWNLLVPQRPEDTHGVPAGGLYDDMMDLPFDTHPGVVTANDTISGYNTNLFNTRHTGTLYLRMDHCTIVKHDTRSLYFWRHGSGNVEALITNTNIIGLDGPDTAGGGNFRWRGIDNGEWMAEMLNSKWWNYATRDVRLNPNPGQWPLGFQNFDEWTSTDPAMVDLVAEGGLDIGEALDLIPLDADTLTTFIPDSLELILSEDDDVIGYIPPPTAPPGPLTIGGEDIPVPVGVGPFQRGDCNGDGSVDITDGVNLLSFTFGGAAAPPCVAACDFNRDGALNITTAVYIFNFLFAGGGAIPDPTGGCGLSSEESDMNLGCETVAQNCQ